MELLELAVSHGFTQVNVCVNSLFLCITFVFLCISWYGWTTVYLATHLVKDIGLFLVRGQKTLTVDSFSWQASWMMAYQIKRDSKAPLVDVHP
jgi:hypothetical protein